MSRMTWRRLTMWLPLAGTAAAGVFAVVLVTTVDDPTIDDAERVIGGAMFASPFILLAVVQVVCSCYVGDRIGLPRLGGLLAITVGAASVSALIAWLFVLQVGRGYPWRDYVLEHGALIALLLLPLPAAWLVRGEERSGSAGDPHVRSSK